MLGRLLFFAFCALSYEEISDLRLLQPLNLGKRLSLDPFDTLNHFAHLNKTRTPGSGGSIYTREYIKSHFDSLGTLWDVYEDNFEAHGFNFSSIVARTEPYKKTLVLAAHYDSKIEPEGFIGAIDSAVSVGIMLDIAESINTLLSTGLGEMGLKLVFFDGEEAIEHWTPDDSIYGAKHLHAQWEQSNNLGAIELFVLLDLLGADQNYVPSYFPQTHDSYNDLALLERKLSHVFPDIMSGENFFHEPDDMFVREYYGTIQDDHLPFLRSSVPVVHLIPKTFPAIWHTIGDNFDCVDIHAVQRWELILAAFILENLEVPITV